MSERDELSEWMHAWQSDEPIPAATRQAIGQRVARSQRWWLLGTVAEAVIGVVGLGVTVMVGLRAEQTVERVAMASLTVVALLTMAAGWWLRRGMWRPATESTAAWIDFLSHRATRRVQMAWVGAAVLPIEVVIFVPWIISRAQRDGAGSDSTLLLGFALLAGLSAAIGSGLFFLRRQAVRELDQLMRLRRDLQ